MRCAAPSTPNNGVALGQADYGVGDTIVFECEENYTPDGSLVAVCGEDGSFGELSLICVKGSVAANEFVWLI